MISLILPSAWPWALTTSSPASVLAAMIAGPGPEPASFGVPTIVAPSTGFSEQVMAISHSFSFASNGAQPPHNGRPSQSFAEYQQEVFQFPQALTAAVGDRPWQLSGRDAAGRTGRAVRPWPVRAPGGGGRAACDRHD